MADDKVRTEQAQRARSARLTGVERKVGLVALVAVGLLLGLVVITRPFDPPWLFLALLVGSLLILGRSLRRTPWRYRRMAVAGAGAVMVWWGAAYWVGAPTLTLWAGLLLITGGLLIGATAWGAVAHRTSPHLGGQ